MGIAPTLVGIIPTLYVICRNLSYKIQQCGNISLKFLKCCPTHVGTMLLTQVLILVHHSKVAVFYVKTCATS